jgi:hypothetical protein
VVEQLAKEAPLPITTAAVPFAPVQEAGTAPTSPPNPVMSAEKAGPAVPKSHDTLSKIFSLFGTARTPTNCISISDCKSAVVTTGVVTDTSQDYEQDIDEEEETVMNPVLEHMEMEPGDGVELIR